MAHLENLKTTGWYKENVRNFIVIFFYTYILLSHIQNILFIQLHFIVFQKQMLNISEVKCINIFNC